MNIISMAWTTPAFVAQRKTVTRRSWSPVYARKFKKGDIIEAYSKAPKWGGFPIGKLELTETPYRERTGVHRTAGVDVGYDISLADFYHAEGFAYLDDEYRRITGNDGPLWETTVRWVEADTEHWVVPFRIIEIYRDAYMFLNDDEILRCVKKLREVIGR